MQKKVFYLFRHGETEWNHLGRMQGQVDIPLNARGISQAEALRSFFDGDEFKAIRSNATELVKSVVSSQLGRAHETARIALRISIDDGAQIRKDARFAETHLGQAEGLTREELASKFGEHSWLEWIGLGPESWLAKFPGGETKGEVRDRALQALQDLAKEDRAVWFIATHGGLLRRVLHHFHPAEQMPIDVVNGSVFKFEFEDGIWTAHKVPVFTPA